MAKSEIVADNALLARIADALERLAPPFRKRVISMGRMPLSGMRMKIG